MPPIGSNAPGRYTTRRFVDYQEHVGLVPGIEKYVAAFTSESAWGDDGYLTGKGLIPLSKDVRKQQAEAARALTALQF